MVILAASGCETARILLNSKSAHFPNGLANDHGMVGRYLMDTVGSNLAARFPRWKNCPPHNEDGASRHAHLRAVVALPGAARGSSASPRGYHIEIGGGRRCPPWAIPAPDLTGGNYGKKFKEDARRYYGSTSASTAAAR